jgi:PAS domain-containing protein
MRRGSYPRNEIAVFTIDHSGRILDCDGSVERVFGCPPANLVERDIGTLIPRLKEIGIMRDGKVNSDLKCLCQAGASFAISQREAQPCDSRMLVIDLSSTTAFRLRVFVWRNA